MKLDTVRVIEFEVGICCDEVQYWKKSITVKAAVRAPHFSKNQKIFNLFNYRRKLQKDNIFC